MLNIDICTQGKRKKKQTKNRQTHRTSDTGAKTNFSQDLKDTIEEGQYIWQAGSMAFPEPPWDIIYQTGWHFEIQRESLAAAWAQAQPEQVTDKLWAAYRKGQFSPGEGTDGHCHRARTPSQLAPAEGQCLSGGGELPHH